MRSDRATVMLLLMFGAFVNCGEESPLSPDSRRAGCFDYTYGGGLIRRGGLSIPVRVAAVDHAKAYVGSDSMLQIIDIADPDQPVLLGSVAVPGLPWDIAIAGTSALVLGRHWPENRFTLSIVDVSNPMAPVTVDTLNTDGATEMHVDESLVCLNVASRKLISIDIGTPSAARIVGERMIVTVAVAVKGRLVYVGADRKLAVLDLMDSELSAVSLQNLPFVPPRGIILGGRLYLHGNGLIVMDLSDAEHPEVVATNGDFNSTLFAGKGARAYARTKDEAGREFLEVIDFSDPLLPVTESRIRAGIPILTCAFVGSQVFAVGSPFNLYALDLSAPAAPGRIGQLTTPSGGGGFGVMGSAAYVSNGSLGLAVVDLTNPAFPQVQRNIPFPHGGWVRDVAVEGRYAYALWYVGSWDRSTLYVVDISQPAMPIVGKVDFESSAFAVEVTGSRAHVLAYGGKYYSVDMTDRTVPAVAGLVELFEPEDFAIDGAYVYVAGGEKLYVLDVSNLASPEILSSLNVQGTGVTIRGTHLYVVGQGGLEVVDISSPASMTVVGGASVGARCITTDGQYAYAARSTQMYSTATDMVVLSLKNPAVPVILGSVDLGEVNVRAIAASDSYVYVSGSMGPDLGVLDVLAEQCP